jgi:leucyl/phenylalanyl-tRNA--protein transferase
MTGIVWLDPSLPPDALPNPAQALSEPNGLLAAGGVLSTDWLLAAYRKGIFPWYEDGQPILWWSPDPRFVLFPDELHCSRSLRRTLRKTTFVHTADRAFDAVVDGCAAPRHAMDSTWITSEMAGAYKELHRQGWAHSFESWQDGELVGGLYGVALGRVFFGESMFSRSSDASKTAFVHAVNYLQEQNTELIDCQVATSHLSTFGARPIERGQFLRKLDDLIEIATPGASWERSFDASLPQR